MHSIKEGVIATYSPVDMGIIFKAKSDHSKYDNSLLYQDILRYPVEHNYTDGFKFNELARWLIKNSTEFSKYYTDSKAHTPMTTRIAYRRHRIQGCVDNLIGLGIMKEKSTVKSEKNMLDIPFYDFTTEGYLLAWIMEVHRQDSKEKKEKIHYEKISVANECIMDIIESCSKINGSCNLIFITRFFKNCVKQNIFTDIVVFFMQSIFNKYTLSSAREFLVLFLGLRNMLNWILASSQIFRQTLDDLDEETKKLVLFQFKMEIEAYYKTHHLKQIVEATELNKILAKDHKEILEYLHLDIVMYPGKKWQIMQIDNIQDFSKVTIPGFCTECNSESPFLYNTDTYVKHIESITSSFPSTVVCGDCSNCGKAFSACARIMTFSHFVSAWA